MPKKCNNVFPPADEANSNEMVLRYPEPSDSQRRAYQDMKRDQLVNLRGFQSPEEFGAFVEQYTQRAFMTDQASLAASNIGRVNSMSNLLAMYSPSWLGPDNPARQLRDWLRDAQTQGRHLLDTTEFWAKDMGDSAARFQFTATLRDAYNEFLGTAGTKKLSKPDLDLLWADMVELGQKERLMRQNGSNEFSFRAQQRQVNQMFDRARKFGFSDQDISTMMSATKKHADVMDATRGVVNAAGIELQATPNMGYMPRIATDDATFFLRKAEAERLGLDSINSRAAATAANVLKSRNMDDFVVEDVLLYAEAIGMDVPDGGRNLRQKYNKLSSEADKLAERVATRPKGRTDVQQAEMEAKLDKMTTEAGNLREAMQRAEMGASAQVAAHFTDERVLLHDFIERIPPDKLDWMVDNGIIGKVPMTSRRVLEVLKQRYNLPFEGLADLIETDPVRSFELYKRNLSSALGASQLVNDIHVNAPALGLGVTGQVFRENPSQYAGYRPMAQLLEKYKIGTANKAAGDVRLSPYVYDQMDAIMKASTEPAVLASMERPLRSLTAWFKSSVLATPQFIMRNGFEVMIQSWRAGTNMAKMQPAMQYYRDFMRYGPDSLPTEKVFANGQYSVRDLFENAVQSGRLKLSSPIEGVSITGSVRTETERMARMAGYNHNPNAVFDHNNFIPFVQRLGQQLQAEGVIDGTQFALGRLNKAQRQLFENMITPLAMFQDAAVMANLMSTLDDGPWARVGQFFSTTTSPAFANVNDAMRHIDEYIYRYQTGVADNWVKEYVPFWSYMSNAMPAALRGVFREPGQYMAYQRLYAAINGDARSDDEFTEAATPSWFGEMVPVVFRDPQGRDGMWFTVDMSRIDPMMDMVRRVSAISDMGSRAMGNRTGRFDDQINQIMGKGDTDFFADLAGSNLGPVINTVIAAVTQRDAFRGRDFEQESEMFGIELTPKGVFSGGFQRYLADTWLPQLRWVERQAQLAGLANSVEVGPDGEERVRPELTNAFTASLDMLGFNVTTIDIARGLQNTEIGMRVTAFQIRDEVRALESRLKSEQDPEKRHEMMVRAEMLKALQQQVELISEDAEGVLIERGSPTYNDRRDRIRERSEASLEEYYQMQEQINQ